MARLVVIGLLLSLTMVSLPSNVGTAEACWCRSNRVTEVIENAEQAFTFEVTELVVVDDENAVAYGDVVEVFKGTVNSRVRVGLSFQKTCIDILLLDKGLVLGAIGSKGKYKAKGVCSGIDADKVVRPVLLPVVQPTEPKPARFIRADSTVGARVAVLDASLRPAHFGPGRGRVEEFAMCPGGKKVLELVVGNAERGAVTVEVRDLASLAIEAAYEIDWDRREARRFRDFDCHDDGGDSFSYLLFRGPGLAGPGAVVDIWRDGEVTQVPADGAIAATVDLGRGLAHVLVPTPAPRVEKWGVDQPQLVATFDLPDMEPVDLAVEPESGVVAVLGGSLDEEAEPRGGGFLARIADGQLEVEEISEAARPNKIEFLDGSLYTVVNIKGTGRSYQKRRLDGSITGNFVVAGVSQVDIAVSGETLAIRGGRTEYRTFVNNLFTASRSVDRPGPIAALREDGSDVAVSAQDVPPVVVAEGAIVEGGPLPPSERSIREAPSPRGWVAAAVAAALAALAIAVAARRRRSKTEDDGWMA